MVNDPDRDPIESTGPTGPVDPWVHDAETMLHRPATGPGQDPNATRINRPVDATAVGSPADPQHWVARANVNPQAPRSSMPRAWEEDPAREDDPYGGRSWFTPVILGVVGFVLLIAVGIGLFLIYQNNNGKAGQPAASAAATTAAAPPTTAAAPTSAAPTTVAPSSAPPSPSGPAVAVIPTLRGVPRQDATDQLKALGFNVNVVQVDDPTVDPGTVSRTDPAEGTPVTAGSTITLFVAKQPAQPSRSAHPSTSASAR